MHSLRFCPFFAAALGKKGGLIPPGSMQRENENDSEDEFTRQNTDRMVAFGNAHALLRGEGYPSPRGRAVGHLSDDGRRAVTVSLRRRQLPHLPLLPRTLHPGREPHTLRHPFLHPSRTGHPPRATLWPARRFVQPPGTARLLNHRPAQRRFHRPTEARGARVSAIHYPFIF